MAGTNINVIDKFAFTVEFDELPIGTLFRVLPNGPIFIKTPIIIRSGSTYDCISLSNGYPGEVAVSKVIPIHDINLEVIS